MDNWKLHFKKLSPYISYRYLEEVAFSYAALESNICLIPVHPKSQSNWHLLDRNTSLFHYGGEYRFSDKLKQVISSNAIDDFQKIPNLTEDAKEKEILQLIFNSFVNYRQSLIFNE